jgi:outer membrane protein assembly factor BamB
VFALAMRDAAKLGGFKLAPGQGPAVIATSGPVTLTDHVRSYEIAGGAGWHQIVAFDLTTGEGVWKQDLGAAPIDDGGVAIPMGDAGGAAAMDRGTVWLLQGGRRRAFRASDGVEFSVN